MLSLESQVQNQAFRGIYQLVSHYSHHSLTSDIASQLNRTHLDEPISRPAQEEFKGGESPYLLPKISTISKTALRLGQAGAGYQAAKSRPGFGRRAERPESVLSSAARHSGSTEFGQSFRNLPIAPKVPTAQNLRRDDSGSSLNSRGSLDYKSSSASSLSRDSRVSTTSDYGSGYEDQVIGAFFKNQNSGKTVYGVGSYEDAQRSIAPSASWKPIRSDSRPAYEEEEDRHDLLC
jgi:hypothetical protein